MYQYFVIGNTNGYKVPHNSTEAEPEKESRVDFSGHATTPQMI